MYGYFLLLKHTLWACINNTTVVCTLYLSYTSAGSVCVFATFSQLVAVVFTRWGTDQTFDAGGRRTCWRTQLHDDSCRRHNGSDLINDVQGRPVRGTGAAAYFYLCRGECSGGVKSPPTHKFPSRWGPCTGLQRHLCRSRLLSFPKTTTAVLLLAKYCPSTLQLTRGTSTRRCGPRCRTFPRAWGPLYSGRTRSLLAGWV